ncbi:helix-turn-helix transcriptional regulator [Natronorubrum aibiense]|uniref:MarR family transcriptional regulator n=1 Tax=Natronorubrum aibiense TaxID=348826 RepID=A0A5P9P3Z5_9EURY|nr:MarR family transcriptional regulator [Natronorubrum aibiense]QFU82697.1 MarR family transcriptional regulator [Natronorubrum aibiense]
MLLSDSETPLDDIEYLARSEHRVTTLEAVAAAPQSRAALQELTGASRSTIGRTLREFEARYWVRRDRSRYEATPLGAFVVSGLQDLLERIETERTLREGWQWLPAEVSDVIVEMGADAVVTVARADDPYRPVNRFVSLLSETERFRFVGADQALLEPCKDELRRRIVDGMTTEIIDPPAVARHILSTYPDHCAGPLESEYLAVLLHDDLPAYGLCLFDERIGLCGYNADNGTVQVFIDTDAPTAREWAESTYEARRRDARPLEADALEQ